MPQLVAGSVFAGYQIDGIAGEGGMGRVYRATEIALARPVALKLIADDFADDRKFRERFQRESMLAASIDHPNVIPIYEAGEVDGELYIAMRFVDGTDLRKLVESVGPLDPARAVRMISQVGSALDAAHRRGLVHRDVKPGNVLLTGEGEEEHAYLTDFGLVKSLAADGAGATTAGMFVGTPDFAAPEQVQGQDADTRSDVYTLGCVLFYALAGKSPFLRDSQLGTMFAHVNEPAPELLEHAPNVPPALAAVVARSLAKDPALRQQSAGELAREAVEALYGEAPVASGSTPRSRPALPSQPGSATPRRAPRALGFILPGILGLGLVVAALAALGVFSSRGGDKDTAAPPVADAKPTATAPATPAAVSQPKVGASVDLGGGPDGIAVGDDGTVWVSDANRGTVQRIDAKSNEPVGDPIPVGPAPDGIATAKKVTWVASTGDNKVRRIETDPNPVVVGTIPVGKEPNGVSLGKQLVWVTNSGDDSVTRIDRGSATVVGSPIGVGANPIGVFVGASTVWVANHDDDTVTRIDPSTTEIVGGPIRVGKGPRGVTEAFGAAWVANSDDGTVTKIDADSGKPAGDPIRVGGDPRDLTAGGGFVWVANARDNSVSQIDPKTSRVIGRAVSVGDDPIGISFGEGAVWTSNHQNGTVTRIDP
jgi:YVTN family beta-propeller protein